MFCSQPCHMHAQLTLLKLSKLPSRSPKLLHPFLPCCTPAANPDPPRWVYLVNALAVVVYVHLDCLDGKQARRTKSSSPLGQLFDHGCDALSVNLLLANIGVTMSMPCSWGHGIGNFGVSALVGSEALRVGRRIPILEQSYSNCSTGSVGCGAVVESCRFVVMQQVAEGFGCKDERCRGWHILSTAACTHAWTLAAPVRGLQGCELPWRSLTPCSCTPQVMFTWILAQWEEYHTSIMLYGNSYYGVLEANYCIAALHLVTFFVGPWLWRVPATDIIPLKQLEGVRESAGGLSMFFVNNCRLQVAGVYTLHFASHNSRVTGYLHDVQERRGGHCVRSGRQAGRQAEDRQGRQNLEESGGRGRPGVGPTGPSCTLCTGM